MLMVFTGKKMGIFQCYVSLPEVSGGGVPHTPIQGDSGFLETAKRLVKLEWNEYLRLGCNHPLGCPGKEVLVKG